MRIFTTLILAGCALCASAANPVKYELKVGDFNELKVIDPIKVVYSSNADSAGLAVFICPPEHASQFIFNNPNNKGVLSIQLSNDESSDPHPTVHVYSNFLTKVENDGDSLVKVLNPGGGPKFSAKIVGNGRLSIDKVKSTDVNATIATGNGTIVISGECERANFNLVGTGVIEADGLKAEEVSVKALGTGTVGVWPLKTLNVTGLSSTKIYYKGDPKIKRSGMGAKIIKI